MSKPAFELGQRVTFTHGLHRLTEDVMRKAWVPHPNEEMATTPRDGLIVGKRRLANGTVRWEEWGADFDASEYFTAYLIAFDLHRTPVYVRPEHIEPTESETTS